MVGHVGVSSTLITMPLVGPWNFKSSNGQQSLRPVSREEKLTEQITESLRPFQNGILDEK